MATIQTFPDTTALTTAAVEYIVALAASAIAERGSFSIALSGGSTPKPVYELLATEPYVGRVDWVNVQIYWSDERCVPPEDPQSNYRMAREALLNHVPIRPEHVYRMRGEDDPLAEAEGYASELPAEGLDLVLLGMGNDGHTASLFPGMQSVHEQTRLVSAEFIPKVNMWRITLTPVAINAARNVAFLVAGADKAERLREVVEGPRRVAELPSQAVQPTSGALTWLLDEAAAAQLTTGDFSGSTD